MLENLADKLKEVVPTKVWENIPVVVICAGGFLIVKCVVGGVCGAISRRRMLARWNNTPKDVVIVHRFPSAKTCPNASPFVVKLETYLRMAGIQYEVDEKDYFSVKGKSPWISLNGEHIADSQLCIEFLSKKFNKTIGNYSKEELAVAKMARITMDEHFYWGLLLWRYIYTKGQDCHKFMDYNRHLLNFMLWTFRGKMGQSCIAQGTGRHSQEDVIRMMCDDLRALSTYLGDKKFLLGETPCEDDCAVFGELAEIVWCCPNSPFEKLINEELRNLKEYCMRMKATFWPDWNEWCSTLRYQKKNN